VDGIDSNGAHCLQAATDKAPQLNASHNVVSASEQAVVLSRHHERSVCTHHGMRIRLSCCQQAQGRPQALLTVRHVVHRTVTACTHSTDCVTTSCVMQLLCIYLFHELPPGVPQAAAQGLAQVLPGQEGGLILANSAENRLAFDDGLGKLNDFNELYYSTYTAEALGKMLWYVMKRCVPAAAGFSHV